VEEKEIRAKGKESNLSTVPPDKLKEERHRGPKKWDEDN